MNPRTSFLFWRWTPSRGVVSEHESISSFLIKQSHWERGMTCKVQIRQTDKAMIHKGSKQSSKTDHWNENIIQHPGIFSIYQTMVGYIVSKRLFYSAFLNGHLMLTVFTQWAPKSSFHMQNEYLPTSSFCCFKPRHLTF